MIDLHVHTTFSDGEYSPSQIVDMANEKGMRALAITDHDNIDGLPEAFKESKVEIMSGVELGADEKDTEIHILGYLFDYGDKNLQHALKNLREGREKRNEAMIEKLKGLGINMTIEEVKEKVHEGSAGRPHIASVMLEKGYVSSFQEAFEKFLGKGKPAYVEREKFTARDCMRIILDAGGIPVLAHPRFIKGDLEMIVEEYVGHGLQGIEAYYSEHTPHETEGYIGLARRFDLVTTGGTDFHGRAITPNVELGGTRVPEAIVGELKERWRKVQRG